MSDNLVEREVDDLFEKTRQEYEAAERRLSDRLSIVRDVLARLGNSGVKGDGGITECGALPPSVDIRRFLSERGRPAHQAEIVRVVGDLRKAEYPHLRRPYSDVWKSLEYHNRHNLDVVCVKQEGNRWVRAKLTPKRRFPRVKGGSPDRPEWYEGSANYFWFKDKLDPHSSSGV
jgi:hypothetical protein